MARELRAFTVLPEDLRSVSAPLSGGSQMPVTSTSRDLISFGFLMFHVANNNKKNFKSEHIYNYQFILSTNLPSCTGVRMPDMVEDAEVKETVPIPGGSGACVRLM